jgi:hypothetical protein
MGNVRAKTISTQVVEISGKKGADVLEATGAAHIGALQDFFSRDEADHKPAGTGDSGTDATKMGAILLRITRVLAGFSDFLVFRLMYVCPASVTVRRGST